MNRWEEIRHEINNVRIPGQSEHTEDPRWAQLGVAAKRIAEQEEINAELAESNLRLSRNLTPAENQSGYSRLQWAEDLIRQLPDVHEGRNSWLLNFAEKKS